MKKPIRELLHMDYDDHGYGRWVLLSLLYAIQKKCKPQISGMERILRLFIVFIHDYIVLNECFRSIKGFFLTLKGNSFLKSY